MTFTPRISKFEYRSDIDGLRALSVLGVVGFHAGQKLVPGGYVGVDVFFVISGFLISGIIFTELDKGRFSFIGFYARRIRRIFPALLLILAATLVAGALLLLPTAFARVGREAIAGAAFFSNILYWWDTGYFDTAAAQKPLLHLWSLGIEEQFYFIWPLAAVLLWRVKTQLPIFLVIVVLVSFAAGVWTTAREPSSAFYLLHTRFWELLVGAALAYFVMCRPDPLRRMPLVRELASITGFVTIAVAFARFSSGTPFPGWRAIIPVMAAALIIASGPHATLNRVLLGWRPLVLIGLISYPLYLWHWPLLAFSRLLNAPNEPAGWEIALLVAASFLLAWLTYRTIEVPIRSAKTVTIRRMATVLTSVMICVFASAILVVQTQGWPQRFGPEVERLMAFSFDQNKEWRVGTCFSLVTASLPDLKSECVEPENGTEPLLMLWGNSHAAQLYPGLKSLQRKAKFRIAQFTFGSCPPIPGWNVRTEPFCEAANDRVLAWARQATPHVAVLASTWDYRDIRGIADYQNLSSVVQALESAGVKRVIVVGPAPRWPETLRELVIKRVLKDPDSKFSERIDTTFENLPIDAAMKRLSLNSGYRYVSAFDVFCDGRGCLASIDGKPDGLTSLDTHHLTPKASELLAPAILREAFQ